MPTGQQIVNAALTRLGILEQSGTPSASDSTDALVNLNDMWDAWSVDEGLIYAVQKKQIGPLPPNNPAVNIGPGVNLGFLPSKIYGGVFIATVGAAQTRRALKMVSQEEYYAHGDLGAVSSTPDEMYCEWDISPSGGFMTVFLYAAPACPVTSYLELEIGAQFQLWTLGGQYFIPHAFQDAIEWSLAFRLLSTFGAAVAPEIAQNVMINGAKAESRIREMNAKNRMLPPPSVVPPEQQLMAATPQPAPKL